MNSQRKRKRIPPLQLLGLIIGAVTVAGFTVAGILWSLSLNEPDKLEAFQALVDSLGPAGWFVLLAIQIVQIVLAFIPGGPIQLAAGALYGPLAGMAVCFVGNILATVVVFWLVRRFGRRIINLFVDREEILRFSFVQNEKRLEGLVLILFFIPGTPKDALTYLFALTPLTLKRFILLSTLARAPGIITSVLAGDSIVQGEWLTAAILFVVITLISGTGLLLRKKISHLGKGSRESK